MPVAFSQIGHTSTHDQVTSKWYPYTERNPNGNWRRRARLDRSQPGDDSAGNECFAVHRGDICDFGCFFGMREGGLMLSLTECS